MADRARKVQRAPDDYIKNNPIHLHHPRIRHRILPLLIHLQQLLDPVKKFPDCKLLIITLKKKYKKRLSIVQSYHNKQPQNWHANL